MEIDSEELVVDGNNIHEELLRQPLLYQKYTALFAQKAFEQAEAKRVLEKEKAELSLMMKAKPKEYGLPKTSDETVKEAVISNEDIDDLVSKHNQINMEYKTLEGIVKALEQRGRLLESEARLMVMGYFQETTGVSQNTQTFMNAHMDKVKMAMDARNDQTQQETETNEA